MIGKILVFCDKCGLPYVEQARSEWFENGFELIVRDFDPVPEKMDYEAYYLIVFSMGTDRMEECLAYIRFLRQLTAIPVAVFPCENLEPAQELSVYRTGANKVIALSSDMKEAIKACLCLIQGGLTKRSHPAKSTTLYVDHRLILNIGRYTVNVDGMEVALPRKEFEILRFLMEHRGQIMTHAQIFRQVWGAEYEDASRDTLRVQIHHLRTKIQPKPSLPQYIKTKHGIGYSFDPKIDDYYRK